MLKHKIACVATFVLWMSAHAGTQPTAPTGAGTVVHGGSGKGHWRTYDVEDGLASGSVFSITQDRDGNLWFGTFGGASRFDGQTWTTFTIKDGLANNGVQAIIQDRDGNFWFGTRGGGVSRFDGQTWTTFTTEDGLAHNSVRSGLQDRDGNLWFGTRGGGVSCFDGKNWTTFTTKDGLVGNSVMGITQDQRGNIWFATYSGVSRFDGKTWTTFTTQDGLASSLLWSAFTDREGYLWFGTGNGITRFRQPAPSPPPVFVQDVVADRRYEGVAELNLPAPLSLVSFEFGSQSFNTRPEAYVARDPHPHERHPGLCPNLTEKPRSGRAAPPRRGDHPQERRPPAQPDQRCARHLQDRGRPHGPEPR